MKIINRQFALAAGAILLFPAVYFITAAFMHFETNIPGLWKPVDPLKNQPGWNISLLILFGPVLAFLLNFFSIVKIVGLNGKEDVQVSFSIRKNWINIVMAGISVLAMLCLVGYLFTENFG
jgi:hypothetical protein